MSTAQHRYEQFISLPFSSLKITPVIELPPDYEVYDFSSGYDANRKLKSPFGIGRYAEKRPGMYVTEQFEGIRNIHMGIDIGAPAGTPIRSCLDGVLFDFANHTQPGDYGPTLILQHEIEGIRFWILYGHLAATSLVNKTRGQAISKGETIATVGTKSENGGWNPHTHFQLSLVEPVNADLPGAVSDRDLGAARMLYPDPQLILGKFYT